MMLTKQQLAERYQVSIRTISQWMRDRRIPFIQIGRVIRFDAQVVDAALNHKQKA